MPDSAFHTMTAPGRGPSHSARLPFARAVSCLVALGFGVGALAQTPVLPAPKYAITVTPDETTQGDLQVVQDSTVGSADNQEVTRSVRRLMGGATSEIMLLARQRVDAERNLTLNDGTVVPLVDGDRVEVSSTRGGPRVILVFTLPTNGPGHGRPLFVVLNTPGCQRLIAMEQTPPIVLPCSR